MKYNYTYEVVSRVEVTAASAEEALTKVVQGRSTKSEIVSLSVVAINSAVLKATRANSNV